MGPVLVPIEPWHSHTQHVRVPFVDCYRFICCPLGIEGPVQLYQNIYTMRPVRGLVTLDDELLELPQLSKGGAQRRTMPSVPSNFLLTNSEVEGQNSTPFSQAIPVPVRKRP